MKTQVVVIHGGDTFDTYEGYLKFLTDFTFDRDYFTKKGWKSSLQEKLGNGFEVIQPRMPSSLNAKYMEWKIWFEKFFPFLNDGLILVGHSLGALFLAKYLTKNKFPKKIKATFLIAPPFDSTDTESLADFIIPRDLNGLQNQGSKIFLIQSKDDPIVPFINHEKYRKLLPKSEVVIFENRGHFLQEEFPELVTLIQNL